MTALFGQVSGGEVDGNTRPREPQANRIESIANSLATFRNRLVWQTNNRKVVLTRRYLHLNLYRPSLDSNECNCRDLPINTLSAVIQSKNDVQAD